MQILKHTCPFTGGNFKLIMRRDQDTKITFYHALTGEQFNMEIKDGNVIIPLAAFNEIETVTLNKAAQMLGVTKQRVSKLIKDGKIDALKVNGRYSVITSSVREYDAMARGRKW